jgi:hypothetical protein
VSIQKAVYRIGTGISSKDLINPKSFIEKFGLYLISLIVAILFITVVVFQRYKRRKKFVPKKMEW